MRAFHLQSEQLLAKSLVLENEILAAAERTHDPADEVPEKADHGPKSYRSRWQCSGRKSFISCVGEV
jgi:hypothetical protein